MPANQSDFCFYLGLCMPGVTGAGTTLRLASVYLKKPRSSLPAIDPFRLLSDKKTRDIDSRCKSQEATGAIVKVAIAGNGGCGEELLCLAVLISHSHLVTTKQCINAYMRVVGHSPHQQLWIRLTSSVGDESNNTLKVEFVAWMGRRFAGPPKRGGNDAEKGSELAIIQLQEADANRLLTENGKFPEACN